jgi:dolichyl-phosphate beta-glucosyltransferase
MTGRPTLSVVIPAFNEEALLTSTLEQVVSHLDSMRITWEVLVVNDGSTDSTAAVAAAFSRRESRVRVVDLPHAGKGAAVRKGMLTARGEWRFIADVDLSMPIAHLERFVEASSGPGGAPIVIASREAPGARRVNEPASRHVIGRCFNLAARALLVRGLSDTQCGFKLFSRAAAERLFPLQRLNGFGFDVEILALARRTGFAVRELPVEWHWVPHSKVTVASGAAGFLDLLRIRWNLVRGAYGDLRIGSPDVHEGFVRDAHLDA